MSPLLLAITFSCLGGLLYGYDLGLIGGALLDIHDEFGTSEAVEESIVGAAKIGAFFGTFMGGALMLHYGRRKAIALDSAFYTLGPLLMAAALHPSMLIAGRFLTGLGIGISAVVAPAYLGEIAPARVRGRVVESYEILLCVGMLASVLVDAALQHLSDNNWRWMVGAPGILGLLLSAALWMLPESPRWLVVNGRLDEALSVIHSIYTSTGLPSGVQSSTEEVEAELMELWSNVEKEKAARRERAVARTSAKPTASAARGAAAAHAPKASASGADRWQQPGDAAGEDRLPLTSGAAMEGAVATAAGAASSAHVVVDVPAPPTPAAELPLRQQHHGYAALQSPAGEDDSPAAAEHGAGVAPQQPDLAPEMARLALVSTRAPDAAVAASAGVSGAAHGEGTAAGQAQGLPGAAADAEARDEERRSSEAGASPSGAEQLEHALLGADDIARPSSAIEPKLFRMLSSVPQGLSPIRTRSWKDDDASSLTDEPPSVRRPGPLQRAGRAASQKLRELSVATDMAGLWRVQRELVSDVWSVLQGPERRAVRLALVIAFIDQAMASTAIVNYAPQVLERAGLQGHGSATLWSSCISASKFAGVLVSLWCVDASGRRPLMLWGGAGCTASLAVLALGDAARSFALILAAMCAFLFAFSASYAAVFWVLCAELFSMSIKATASSAAMAVLFATGAAANLVFLSLHSWLHSWAFVLFAAVSGVGIVYVALNLPETKGLSLAEVQALLQGQPRARQAPAASSAAFTLEEGEPELEELAVQQPWWREALAAFSSRLRSATHSYSRFIEL